MCESGGDLLFLLWPQNQCGALSGRGVVRIRPGVHLRRNGVWLPRTDPKVAAGMSALWV